VEEDLLATSLFQVRRPEEGLGSGTGGMSGRVLVWEAGLSMCILGSLQALGRR
jgi:hypothetical protein